MRLAHGSRWFLALTIAAAASSTAASSPHGERVSGAQNKKPSINVRANPPVGFTPLRVVVTAELKGGNDDYEEFYCASVEWEWGDGTKSENKIDCDPYESGKSEIKRRYVQEHTFRADSVDPVAASPEGPAQYRVKFSLKQKNKVVGSGQTTVEIRNGGGFGGQ
jgi:hypothetical protein